MTYRPLNGEIKTTLIPIKVVEVNTEFDKMKLNELAAKTLSDANKKARLSVGAHPLHRLLKLDPFSRFPAIKQTISSKPGRGSFGGVQVTDGFTKISQKSGNRMVKISKHGEYFVKWYIRSSSEIVT